MAFRCAICQVIGKRIEEMNVWIKTVAVVARTLHRGAIVSGVY
jgi:hypothetical protein